MVVKKAKTDASAAKGPKAKRYSGFEPLKFKDHTITQKTSGRYEVVNAAGKNVNGADKTKLLLDSKVLKGSFKKESAETAAT